MSGNLIPAPLGWIFKAIDAIDHAVHPSRWGKKQEPIDARDPTYVERDEHEDGGI